MFAKARHTNLLQEVSWLRQRVAELQAERARGLRLDHVTRLRSARVFRDRLAEEVDRARRYRRPLTAAIISIDHFHALEREHGFTAADDLLATVAHRLSVLMRSHDLIGRTGQAEFGLLLTDTSAQGALQSLERLRAELEHAGDGAIRAASASMGIAALERGMSAEGLIASARIACERAQRSGGGQAVLAAERDLVTAGPSRSRRAAIEVLAVTLLELDSLIGERGEAVIETAGAGARGLGCAARQVEQVRSAALLHDIGKVALPDEILHKRGSLTEQESRLMQEHPAIGERMLRRLPGFATVAPIIRHEHERWDGHGYPDGLAGEAIPLGSRIIHAAGAYHDITSDRPDRAARSHAEAIAELTSSAGSRFDPRVIEALIAYLDGRRDPSAGDRRPPASGAPPAVTAGGA